MFRSLLMGLAVSASVSVAEASERFLVVSSAEVLPPGLARHVERAGLRVVGGVPGIGLLVVEGAPSRRAAAARLPGVQAVVPDLAVHLEDTGVFAEIALDALPLSDGDDPLLDWQWGLLAVGAPAAWEAGLTGAGARIAVMDQGLDCDHPDLHDVIDVASSVSLIPDEEPCNVGPAGTHGTMVAGIAAASANGVGGVGVAPGATIVGVKVFPQRSPSTSWSTILAGLAAVAEADVDVVNMSFSATLLRDGDPSTGMTAEDVRAFVSVTERALREVARSGALLVAAAGNNGRDRDAEDPATIVLPADSPRVIAVSATAPIGWALDPSTDLDVPATYSNHGVPAITLAAPGGQSRYPGREICDLGLRCATFDLVAAPTRTGWGWGMGTSFAAPHVAGVAALLIEALDHPHPEALEAALRRHAEDLGAPGRDPHFGHGRVHTGH